MVRITSFCIHALCSMILFNERTLGDFFLLTLPIIHGKKRVDQFFRFLFLMEIKNPSDSTFHFYEKNWPSRYISILIQNVQNGHFLACQWQNYFFFHKNRKLRTNSERKFTINNESDRVVNGMSENRSQISTIYQKSQWVQLQQLRGLTRTVCENILSMIKIFF